MSAKTKLWYPHHIERYRRKTGHLSLAEHGAYRLLMDWYWDRRGPLPANEERLRRYLRADCREWKKIRETVLEFFTLTDDGYRHETIDEIIAESERQYEAKRARIAKARLAKAAKHASNDISDNRDDCRHDDSDEDNPEIVPDEHTSLSSSSYSPDGEPSGGVGARARSVEETVSVSRRTEASDVRQVLGAWEAFAGRLAGAIPGEQLNIDQSIGRNTKARLLAMIERASASPLLRGETGRIGIMPLCWLWDDEKIAKVLRGEYDGNGNSGATFRSGSAGKMDDLRAAVDRAKEIDRSRRESVPGDEPEHGRRAIGAR